MKKFFSVFWLVMRTTAFPTRDFRGKCVCGKFRAALLRAASPAWVWSSATTTHDQRSLGDQSNQPDRL